MPGIFISYRRGDSAGYAGRLADELIARFGQDRVFVDIEGLKPGDDYIESIERSVGSCDALLVIIGHRWLTETDEGGRRRLDDPDDLHRLEIAEALERNVRVIPVLVGGARMPRTQDLPDGLTRLARRQSCEIGDARWHYDVQQLIGVLDAEIRRRDLEREPPAAPTVPTARAVPADDRPPTAARRASAQQLAVWVGLGWLIAAAIGESGYLTGRPWIGILQLSLPWWIGATLGALVTMLTVRGASDWLGRMLATAVAVGLGVVLLDGVIYTELRTSMRSDLAPLRDALLAAGTALGPGGVLAATLTVGSAMLCSLLGGLLAAAIAGRRDGLVGAASLLLTAGAALVGALLGVAAQSAFQHLPPWPDHSWSAGFRFALWLLIGAAVVWWRLRTLSKPARIGPPNQREPSPI